MDFIQSYNMLEIPADHNIDLRSGGQGNVKHIVSKTGVEDVTPLVFFE